MDVNCMNCHLIVPACFLDRRVIRTSFRTLLQHISCELLTTTDFLPYDNRYESDIAIAL
jgi:hypothetical protein